MCNPCMLFSLRLEIVLFTSAYISLARTALRHRHGRDSVSGPAPQGSHVLGWPI